MRRYVLPLLALYLDFIIVNAVVGLASFFLGQAWNYMSGEGTPWYAELGVSFTLVGLGRALGLSAGEWLLGPAADMADDETPPRLWPNLVLGTFLMLDGFKQMVRWTELEAVIPVFGMVGTTPLKAGILMATGALYVVAGALVLQFVRGAKLVTLAALVITATSLAFSWRVLPEAIAQVQIARRAAQEIPVRSGEIEFMQQVLPWVTFGGLVLIAALLWLSHEAEE